MKYQLSATVREEDGWSIVFGKNGQISSCNLSATRIFKELSAKNLSATEIYNLCGTDISNEADISVINKWLDKMVLDQKLLLTNDDSRPIPGKYLHIPQLTSQNIRHVRCLSSPLVAIINLTNRCNQKCSFCYVDPRYVSRRSDDLPREKLFEICNRLAKQRVMMVNFLGGEPTARFDDMLAAIDYIHQVNPVCHCTFATNGTYDGGISESQAKELGKRNHVSVRVSIHGHGKEHDKIVGLSGAYEMATKTIMNLVKFAPNTCPSINVTMNKNLLDSHELLIEEMFNLGVDIIEFAPMQFSGCEILNQGADIITAEEDIAMMQKMNLLRSKWLNKGKAILYGGRYNPCIPEFSLNGKVISCGIGESIICDTQGDCYFCHMTVGMREYCGGNIFEKEFTDIWNSEVHQFMLEKSSLPVNQCEGCVQRELCADGCHISAKLVFGDYQAGDPSCPRIRMRLKKNAD